MGGNHIQCTRANGPRRPENGYLLHSTLLFHPQSDRLTVVSILKAEWKKDMPWFCFFALTTNETAF
jgi:hypothetical protein